MRMRRRAFIEGLAVATLLVCWTGTPLALPGGLPQCRQDLATCTTERDTCNTNLQSCSTDLAAAQADLNSCNANLAACNENVAAAQQFPATGQTTAYRPGDDGDVQAGATLSYKDNGDGTITDNNTKLTWEKKSDDGGLHDKDNTYFWDFDEPSIWTWLNAINAEGGTGFAGYTDWRIPNVKELQSIVNYEIGFPGPVVSPEFNNNCTAGATVLTGSCTARSLYWSSTTVPVSPPVFFAENAWFVGFNSGNVAGVGIGAENKFLNTNHVRAVRGGSNLGNSR